MRTYSRYVAAAAVLLILVLPNVAPAEELAGTLTVELEEHQAVGVPILMEVTIKNIGGQSFRYWCGGPATYVNAQKFNAVITDEQGREREVPLSNGQYAQGSGINERIEQGKSATLPAVLEPLPAGAYTLSLNTDAGGWFKDGKMTVDWPAMITPKPVTFTVRDDPAASSVFERDMLRRVRTGEPFARHVAVKYPRELITSALIADLDNEDHAIVLSAIHTLQDMKNVPDGLPTALTKMMTRHLRSDAYPRQLLFDAAHLAGKIGSDEVLDPVLKLIERARDHFEFREALRLLQPFGQAKANTALRDALRDRERKVRAHAAVELSRRGDRVAVDTLVDPEVLKLEPDSFIYAALARFPDDDRATAAIERGLRHPEPHVRESADRAHRDLQARKARREKEAMPSISR